MEGIFVQANKRNSNSRIYPMKLKMLLKALIKELARVFSLGEADHPEDLQVNLDPIFILLKRCG